VPHALLPLDQSEPSLIWFPCSTAVPPKVDEVFKAFRYVPYTALTFSAKQKSARGEEDFVINAQGGITVKNLDRRTERSISELDWIASSKAAEDRTRVHHGEDRAGALSSHHQIVLGIGRSHGWPTALEYDIQQRDLVAANPAHDFSTLDTAALTIIVTAALTAFTSRPTFSSPAPTPSFSRKRSTSSEHDGSPSKKKTRSICFRCGLPGHLPADCKCETTAAGKAPAAFARGAKSRHALAAPNGRQFCFNWAKSSACSFGATCANFHGCSICGDGSHGAGSCTAQT
jgi:hypothetical protein